MWAKNCPTIGAFVEVHARVLGHSFFPLETTLGARDNGLECYSIHVTNANCGLYNGKDYYIVSS